MLCGAFSAPTRLIDGQVGGTASEPAFRTLTPGGRHLVVGFASGDIATLPLNSPLLKRSSVIVDWGSAVRADRGLFRSLCGDIVAALASGELCPAEAVPVPVASASASLTRLAARRWQGELVVALSDETRR